MNTVFFSQKPYTSSLQKSSALASFWNNASADRKAEEKAEKTEKIRALIRGMEESRMPQNKKNGFLELTGTSTKNKKKEAKSKRTYNFKEVEMKILRAKNALGAGQAVIAAKRKVLEVKRKVSAGDGDPEDLQAELTHAKRMELVARKKKHHLELEELVENTGKRDEKQEASEEAAAALKSSLVEAEEEEVTETEDAIFEERSEMLEELTSQAKERSEALSDAAMTELNEMISEFGEEELEQLEEAMAQLENMEVLDPHMSREELEELKRKHRAAEQKAIVKADMDYLKATIKHQMEKGAAIPGMQADFSGYAAGSFVVPQGAAISAPAGIDIQL